MIYNRYLDLHLCTNSSIPQLKDMAGQLGAGDRRFFTHREVTYFYDFEYEPGLDRDDDLSLALRNRLNKPYGYQDSNSKILRFVEVTNSRRSLLQFNNGTISAELRRLRYLGCLVAIEHLKDGKVYPQLQALMSWISDASTINKLRVNGHGAGSSNSGFLMGVAELTPAELVEAFVRHGLTRDGRTDEQIRGIVHAARWKHDTEVNACEKCTAPFTKAWYGSSNKHHCRRCGGIFCAACSAHTVDLETALVGPDKPPAQNVRQARVCGACFNAVRGNTKFQITRRGPASIAPAASPSPNLDKYGLQTITLACCMSAKSDTEYSHEVAQAVSQAQGRFIADSLAGRFVAALRANNIRGLKVTASNQSVTMLTDASGISSLLTIKYPTGKAPLTHIISPNSTKILPSKIWGQDLIVRRTLDLLPSEERPDCYDITVGPSGRDLEFGKVRGSDVEVDGKLDAIQWVLDKFWVFTSWLMRRDTCFTPGGRFQTIRLTPPPMIEKVVLLKSPTTNSEALELWPRGSRQLFKWTKSYEVS